MEKSERRRRRGNRSRGRRNARRKNREIRRRGKRRRKVENWKSQTGISETDQGTETAERKLAKEQKRIEQLNRENEKEAESLRENNAENWGMPTRELPPSAVTKRRHRSRLKGELVKAPPKDIQALQCQEKPPREVEMAICDSSCSSGVSEACGNMQE